MDKVQLKHMPGYGPSDGRCLPCSGVSGRAFSLSSSPSRSDYKSFPLVKIVPLRCASRGSMPSIRCANSSGQRRNPDFSRQNRHGFSRNRNRQSEERDGPDNLEESEILSPKNGPLLSGSGSPKFQATATPGPREKEIVELFRKVQAQLRERAAIKEEKKVEELQGQSKQNETVDSLLKLLRKHSVQQGKRSNNSGNNRDFILDLPGQNGRVSEDKSPTLFNLNNTLKKEVQESEGPSVSRPVSNFRRRSPVPQVKYQPIYSDEDIVKSVSHTNVDGKRKEARLEPEPEPELKFKIGPEDEPDVEAEPYLINGGVFNEVSDEDTSEIEESANEDDDLEEHNVIESRDLSGMKLPELRALAKSRGLKGFSKLKKGELIELLTSGSF